MKLIILHKSHRQLVRILPRECTVKYTPGLEEILKKLNLSIPSFRMIYCTVLPVAKYRIAAEVISDKINTKFNFLCILGRSKEIQKNTLYYNVLENL